MIGVAVRIEKTDEVRKWAEGLPDEFHKRTSLLVGSYALRIEREAKKRAPVAKNILRSSIHTDISRRGQQTRAKVGTDVHYAPYLEYGTGLYGPERRAYEIKPKTKKALAFTARAGTQLATGRALYRSATGRMVLNRRRGAKTVVRKVIHPGIHPQPFLHPPFDRLVPFFMNDLRQIVTALER